MAQLLAFSAGCATAKRALDATWGVGVYGCVVCVNHHSRKLSAFTLLMTAVTVPAAAPGFSTNSAPIATDAGGPTEQNWNWHVQNIEIVQGYPEFPARYSGPNSLPNGGETRETVSLDLMAGVRLWPGAEAHIDGMMWQGFGIGNSLGVDGFPNGEAFRLGSAVPNENIPRLFIRQAIGFGGEQEVVADDPLTLAGRQDVSRLTLTLGKMSAKDIFDNNAYANDPRTQFMNWGLMANEAWDYPADALGYITGFAAELNQPSWALRCSFFQVPRSSNGTALDSHFLEAWGMVTELERRYALGGHPGAIRFLAYLNRAHMGSYQSAVDNFNRGGSIDITTTRAYRSKVGF
ncbi:MAG TPA: carbohydrate porin [Verrucomicrobiae bacterium]|nr:carbohydrate porin [Verrucomicrobiae bacterium]